MSNLLKLFHRLVAVMLSTERTTLDPDSMSLHDWADLPAHHPSRDRAPC
ncbi:hypothetical protein SAMN05428969_0074 [Devosia sp. YR412]|nr:hypothetical protein [Devosia sp. YR412]SEP60284.1 hypothetical protein SAMN05428969_0074 [Devosia sp. YR412]